MVRALKVLVAVLGILLVGGVVALIAMIASRGTATPPRPVAVVAPPAGTAFDTAIDLPAGAHVVSSQTDWPRLVVTLGLPDGSWQILLLDLATGTRLGTIALRGGAK